MGKKIIVNKGDKYGMLTILEEIEPHVSPSGDKKRMVRCVCDCGSDPFEVQLNSLRSGRTVSCGCYNKKMVSERIKERNKKRSKKYNTWILKKDEGICYGFTQKGERFIIDIEDYKLVKDYCWYMDSDGYIRARNTDTGKKILLHRFLMGVADSQNVMVDHISRIKLDNRKSNLRTCSASENAKNKGIRSNNTSNFTGVCFRKDANKWCAYIKVDHKYIHLGMFTSKDDAIKARLQAEKKYFKEFAPNQNLYEQYGIE